MPATFATADVPLQVSASVAVGTPAVGAWVDISASGGGLACLLIGNGASGPSTGLTGYIDTSPDNGATVYPSLYETPAHPLTANLSLAYFADIPRGVRFIRSRFEGNAGQPVQAQADFQQFSGTA